MRVGVLSDIHGNRHALESVLSATAAAGVDELWCLGDIVGYGADPDACVELIRARADVSLCGNHDLGVIGTIPLGDFSAAAHASALWTRRTAAPETLEFLRPLRPEGERYGVAMYHASPRDPVWEYVLSVGQADGCFDREAAQIALIGHSHVALSFTRSEDGTVTGEPRHGGIETTADRGRWLLNPGSVGQPRDEDPRAAWMELDIDSRAIRYHRVDYDIDGAAAAIRAAGLPDSLADRLYLGR